VVIIAYPFVNVKHFQKFSHHKNVKQISIRGKSLPHAFYPLSAATGYRDPKKHFPNDPPLNSCKTKKSFGRVLAEAVYKIRKQHSTHAMLFPS
jgi:hypothetical protein